MKLRGGILYYTLFLMIISVTAVTMILMRYSLFSRSLIASDRAEELENNLRSAFLVYRYDPDLFEAGDSVVIDLYGDSNGVVHMTRERWGIFDIVTVTASAGDLTASRKGVFGEHISADDHALYLPDNGIDISLSGNSFISGVTYTPHGIIRTASIEGRPFVFGTPSEGRRLPSSSSLPAVDSAVTDAVTGLFSNLEPQMRLSDVNFTTDSHFENPYSEPALTLYEQNDIVLTGISLSGHITVCSPGIIFVDATTNLDNVLLLARRIVIDDDFRGSLQAYAIDTLVVRDNVSLTYPSVLAIIQDDDSDGASLNPAITIGTNTSVAGCVIMKAPGDRGRIVIPATTTVTGQVYCNGTVELRGDIRGSIACKKFAFTSDRSVYVNHLLDSDIDMSLLPGGFAGFYVQQAAYDRGLIKWLE